MKIFANRASCKWVNHYMRLVERAKQRTLDGYYERHHVVPRCMGGSDDTDNLVALTPEEHYTAHLLLMKIFPDNGALAQAAVMRCADIPTTPRQNKAYGWVKRRLAMKRRLAKHNSARMKEWHQHNEHPMQGRKHSQEARTKISKGWNGVRKEVFCFSSATGELIATYDSVSIASTAVGLHPQTIYSCIRVPGKRTAGGMSWSYENKSPGILQMHPSGKRKVLVHSDNSKTRNKAWANPKAHKETWLRADAIFDLIQRGNVLSNYARASSSPNTVYRIAQKIKKGWNPLTDNEWKQWKETQ